MIMFSSHLAHRVGVFAALMFSVAVTGQTHAVMPVGGTSGQHKGVLMELHAAKELLEHADHDYDGYRAKAVHHITEAIRDLREAHKAHESGTSKAGQPGLHAQKNNGNGSGQGAGKGAGQKHHEPQASSDAQIEKAAQLLAAAEGKLGSHPKAHAEIQAAISDIAMALKKK